MVICWLFSYLTNATGKRETSEIYFNMNSGNFWVKLLPVKNEF